MLRRSFLSIVSVAFFVTPALALITGGTTEPMNGRGLPEGANELANLNSRIAWWEGPPFGGGQYHFEYQGTTDQLQQAVDLFAKVDSDRKEVRVLSGEAKSFWLGIGDKEKKHPINWQFVVWIPKNWLHLKNARAGLLPPGEEGESPKTSLIVHASANVRWDQIKVPEGLKVVDERLESNGLTAEDGAVLRGTVTDLDGAPLSGATVTVGKEEQHRVATTDQKGAYQIAKIPEGSQQVTCSAPGYAKKDKYYHSFQPTTLKRLEIRLGKATDLRVRVVDENGSPVPNVDITCRGWKDRKGEFYRFAGQQTATSNDNGELVFPGLPIGSVKFSSRTSGYYYNSVLNEHSTGTSPVTLRLQPTGSVKVFVLSAAGQKVTAKYIVQINEKGVDPDKGGVVGSWGGSANIGSDGTYTFKGIPPNDYVITGKPNPGRSGDRTDPVAIRIEGRDHHEIEIVAK